jgi:serine/threonine protein kinase
MGMHNELIQQIQQLSKQLVEREIYTGGRGFYQVLDQLPIAGRTNLFFCRCLEDSKIYLIEFAPQNLAHIELQKYLRRALFLMVLDHEKGIIRAKDFSMDPTRCFVILDWVPGKNLNAVLKSTRLTLKESLWILFDLTAALDHLADFSFIHRNINPSNILLRENTAQIYLSGVEYLTQSDFLQTRLDIDVHNVQYVSPELARSLLFPDKPTFLTPWTDVYSASAVFFHMVTGEPPFSKRKDIEKWAKRPWVPKVQNPNLIRKERKYCQHLIDNTMSTNFYKRWSAYQIREYIQSFLGNSNRVQDMHRWVSQGELPEG